MFLSNAELCKFPKVQSHKYKIYIDKSRFFLKLLKAIQQ